MKKILLLFLFFISISFFSCEPLESECEKNISIGIFGGSQSSLAESLPIKKKWAEIFDAEVVTCGFGGAGFGLWQEKNVLNQLKSNPLFDVYIFWCSTNDAGQIIVNDSELNPNSQSGGLSLCVKYIKEINPKAKLFLFTSTWVAKKWFQDRIPALVRKQIEFCEKNNISYLNQFDPNVLTKEDFYEDEVHFSTDAYWKLESRQTAFLIEMLKK